MAIDLPETDLNRVQRWCKQRIPERAQHQVRLEHESCGHDVILVQRRVPCDAPRHTIRPAMDTTRPLARLRHSAAGWRLYWPDSHTRWHLVDDVPIATNVVPLLEAVDDPGARFTVSFQSLLTLSASARTD